MWEAAYENLAARHKNLKADYRALEAQRDAVYTDENEDEGVRQELNLEAKRGPFGGRVWGREKMGEVWRVRGEFVWVMVDERGWVKKVKVGLEGVKGCGRKVGECLGEAREKIEGRRRRSVVPRVVREDLSL